MTYKKSTLTRIILILAFVIIMILSSLIVYKEETYQKRKIQISESNAKTIVNILADYIDMSFSYMDSLLSNLAQKKDNKYINFTESELAPIFTKLRYASAVMFVDKAGAIKTLINREETLAKIIKSDFEPNIYNFCKQIKEEQTNNLKIFQLKSNKDSFVLVAKKLLRENEEFGGALIIVIKGDYLSAFFKSISKNQKSEMALLTDGNQLLFESPDIIEDMDVMSSIKQESEKFYTQSHKTETMPKFINNYLYVFSFKHLANWPISIALVTYEGNLIKHWLSNIENWALFLIIAIIIIIVVSFFASLILKYFEQTENLERLNIIARKAKTDLAIKVINEGKTYLNAVIAFTDIMYSEYLGVLNAEQKNNTAKIKTWSKHFLALIEDMAKSFNTEGYKLELTAADVDLKELLDKALWMFEEKFKLKSLNFVVSNSINNLPKLHIDSLKVIQIFIDLFEFIIEYSDKEAFIKLDSNYDKGKNLFIIIENDKFLLNEIDVKEMISSNVVIDNLNEIGIKISLVKMFIEMHQGKLDCEFKDSKFYVRIMIPKVRVK
ncbi:MAG: hypothetical protein ACK4OM_06790 [Alphaproteobacteria bacterium]